MATLEGTVPSHSDSLSVEGSRHRKRSVEVAGADGNPKNINLQTMNNADAQLAAEFGYKPVFKREFGYLSTFSFAVSISGLFSTIMTTFSYPLYAGGSAAAVWCWLISGAGCMCLAVSYLGRFLKAGINCFVVVCCRASLRLSNIWRTVSTRTILSLHHKLINFRYFTISRLAPKEWVSSLSW